MFEDAGGEFAKDKPRLFFRRALDAAVAEKGVELLSEFVKIIGEAVGEKVAGDKLEDLPESTDMDAKRDFRRMPDIDAVMRQDLFHICLRFPLDPVDPDIRVEEENGRISLETEHPVIAENVIFCAVGGEVGVFDGPDPQDMG